MIEGRGQTLVPRLTTIVRVALVVPQSFVTEIGTLKVPVWVGVPEITFVDGLKPRQLGKLEVATLNDVGLFEAASVRLND